MTRSVQFVAILIFVFASAAHSQVRALFPCGTLETLQNNFVRENNPDTAGTITPGSQN